MRAARFTWRHLDLVACTALIVGYPVIHVVLGGAR